MTSEPEAALRESVMFMADESTAWPHSETERATLMSVPASGFSGETLGLTTGRQATSIWTPTRIG